MQPLKRVHSSNTTKQECITCMPSPACICRHVRPLLGCCCTDGRHLIAVAVVFNRVTRLLSSWWRRVIVKAARTAKAFYRIASFKVVVSQRKACQRCIFRLRAVAPLPIANTASMHSAAIFSDMRRTARVLLLSSSCLLCRGLTRRNSNLADAISLGMALP